jgi:hypothetical protein
MEAAETVASVCYNFLWDVLDPDGAFGNLLCSFIRSRPSSLFLNLEPLYFQTCRHDFLRGINPNFCEMNALNSEYEASHCLR